jgi:hypothetical protein
MSKTDTQHRVCMYICIGQFSLTLPVSSNPTPVAGTNSRLHEGCVMCLIKFCPYMLAVNLGYVEERRCKLCCRHLACNCAWCVEG